VGFTLSKVTQKEILTGSFSVLVEFLIRLMKKTAPPILVPPPPPKDKPEEKKQKLPIDEK